MSVNGVFAVSCLATASVGGQSAAECSIYPETRKETETGSLDSWMGFKSGNSHRFLEFLSKVFQPSYNKLITIIFTAFLLLFTCLLYLRQVHIQDIVLKSQRSYDIKARHASVMQAISWWTLNIRGRYILQKGADVFDNDLTENGKQRNSACPKCSSNDMPSYFGNRTLAEFHEVFKTWMASRRTKRRNDVTFILNHPGICSGKKQLPLFTSVISTASHSEYRKAIRDTWGGHIKEKGAKLLFFIGIPTKDKYHTRLALEDMKFHDMIQGNYLDVYTNLSIKTLSMLKWVTKYCPQAKYVLKVDDDMFINSEKFLNISIHRNLSMTIAGELAHKWPPVRNRKNKWYVSQEEYPFDMYPDFVFGPSYLLTGDSIKALYEASSYTKTFHLEDVYVTGFAAQIAGVKRINEAGMFNTERDLQPCSYKNLLSSHGHTPADIYRHWKWLKRRNFTCGV